MFLALPILAPSGAGAQEFFEELWRIKLSGDSLNSPVVGDIYATRRPVFVTSDTNGTVAAYDSGTGRRIWSVTLDGGQLTDPILGSFTADGALDVAVASRDPQDKSLYLIEGSTGEELAKFPFATPPIEPPTPFPLPNGEGEPVRHGIAIHAGEPYLLVASDEGTALRPYREIAPTISKSMANAGIPAGPPAVGSIFNESSVDIVFPYERQIAVLERDGSLEVLYSLPREERGVVRSAPIVANVKQNLRVDARDWDEIVFGVFDANTQSSAYYNLEYNENIPVSAPNHPFRQNWETFRDRMSFPQTPRTPATMNWTEDPNHLDIVLSSPTEVRAFIGVGERIFAQTVQGLAVSPAVALSGKGKSAVLFFERGQGQAHVRTPSLGQQQGSYTVPLVPRVVPMIGNFDKDGDPTTEIILISEKEAACYRLPRLELAEIPAISFQTRGGSIYRTGSFNARIQGEENLRRALLNDKIEKLLTKAQAAAADGRWSEARADVDSVLRINPHLSEAQNLSRSVFIRQNLILLIVAGLFGVAVLGAAGYFLFRFLVKSTGMKKARGFIEAGQPELALDIYHRLREKYPKSVPVNDALVQTIIRTGKFTRESIPPLEECYNERDSGPEVTKALVSCYVNVGELDPRVFPLYQKAEELMPESAGLKYLMGKMYRDAGEQRLAEERLRMSVKLDDPPTDAFTELADLLLNTDRATARHQTIFQRAFEAHPDDVGFLRGLCLAMIDGKRIDSEAQKIYEKMLEHDRTYVPALLQLCQAKIQGGLIEEAVVHAHKIQQLDPDNEEGIYLLSQCYLIQGRSDETAIRTLRKASEKFPQDKEILGTLARTFIRQKRADEEAIAIYRRAWKLNPNDLEITRTMAKVAWAQKDMQLVCQTNEKLMEAGVAGPQNVQQLAEAYVATDMREERGEKVLREALKSEGANRKFLTHLSRIYIEADRVDAEALKVYMTAYQEAPSYDIGRMLVKAYYHNDQYAEIARLAPKLLQQRPDDGEVHKIYAQASVASNRMDDAIKEFESILKNNPDDKEALVNLAEAYAQKGQIDGRSVALFQQALEVAPENEQLLLISARVAMTQRRQEDAVQFLKKALKLAPKNVDRIIREVQLLLTKDGEAMRLRWLLAEMLVFANRLREAAEELGNIFESDPSQMQLVVQGYDKILSKDPKNQTALISRGTMYKANGRFEDARKDLEKAFELNPANPDAQRELVDLYQAMLNEHDDVSVRHLLGKVYFKSEEYDKAIAQFQRTSQDYRYENDALKLLGQAFVHKNMLDLALQQFKKLPVDDDLKDILYDLAQRYEAKKDMIGAKTVYKSLFAADIDYKDVKTKFESMAGSTSDPMVFEKTVLQTQLSPEAQRRYELIEELGRGAMGIVYRALDHELDEVVALKILPESISNNPEAVKRFRIEARSARRLSHPNIIRIHDIGEEMGRKFISMEFVEGTDLKAKFRSEGPPEPKILASWCKDIASALGYAHRMGIVHRDIKPANIMITDENEVKVADFGIAKNMGAADATQTGAVMGTPLYMSPEQVRGEQIDHRADIYSFGVMLYELTAGKPPFSEGDLAYQHIHVEPKPIENAHPRWNQLVLRCLAKKRDDRWESLEQMLEFLREFEGEL